MVRDFPRQPKDAGGQQRLEARSPPDPDGQIDPQRRQRGQQDPDRPQAQQVLWLVGRGSEIRGEVLPAHALHQVAAQGREQRGQVQTVIDRGVEVVVGQERALVEGPLNGLYLRLVLIPVVAEVNPAQPGPGDQAQQQGDRRPGHQSAQPPVARRSEIGPGGRTGHRCGLLPGGVADQHTTVVAREGRGRRAGRATQARRSGIAGSARRSERSPSPAPSIRRLRSTRTPVRIRCLTDLSRDG